MSPNELLGDTTGAAAAPAPVALLVEDDAGLREVVARLLARAKYRVMQAQDGAEALDVARDPEIRIDVVITDVWMPVMGGEQFALEMRRLRPEMPIVFISGRAPDGHVEGFLQSGEAAYLSKPFSAEALETVIETVRARTGSDSGSK